MLVRNECHFCLNYPLGDNLCHPVVDCWSWWGDPGCRSKDKQGCSGVTSAEGAPPGNVWERVLINVIWVKEMISLWLHHYTACYISVLNHIRFFHLCSYNVLIWWFVYVLHFFVVEPSLTSVCVYFFFREHIFCGRFSSWDIFWYFDYKILLIVTLNFYCSFEMAVQGGGGGCSKIRTFIIIFD